MQCERFRGNEKGASAREKIGAKPLLVSVAVT
jgi:hypothetical protein